MGSLVPMGCVNGNFLDRVAKAMGRGGRRASIGIDLARGADYTVQSEVRRLPDGSSVTRTVGVMKNDRGLDSIKDLFEHPNARRGRRNGAEE